MECAEELDWVAKLKLLNQYRDRDGLDWDDAKLHLIDLQYADIGPTRVSTTGSSAAGRIERLLDDAAIEAAMHDPPRTPAPTSAGRCLEKYADHVAAASWDSVIFDLPGRESLQRVPTDRPAARQRRPRRRADRPSDSARRWSRRSPAEALLRRPPPVSDPGRPGSLSLSPVQGDTSEEPDTWRSWTAVWWYDVRRARPPRVNACGVAGVDRVEAWPRSRSSRASASQRGLRPRRSLESDVAERKETLDEDVDAILDEIDEVLETNAEDFVKSFIQKGGQ
jgi:ubiquitin-like protein Pup